MYLTCIFTCTFTCTSPVLQGFNFRLSGGRPGPHSKLEIFSELGTCLEDLLPDSGMLQSRWCVILASGCSPSVYCSAAVR
jgi:hypothetical protein